MIGPSPVDPFTRHIELEMTRRRSAFHAVVRINEEMVYQLHVLGYSV